LSRTDHRNDPLATVRAANPADAADLREEIGEEALSRALRRAVAAGAANPRPLGGDAGPFRGGSRRPRRGLAVGLAAALVGTAAALALLLGGGSVGGGGQPAFAAAAIEVAEANPRLLVTAPGWAVADAGEFERDEGEVAFGDGEHRFAVHWYPARSYRRYLRDRALVSAPERSILLGLTATTVRYGIDRNGDDEYATMLAPEGPVFVEVRGAVGDRAAYDAVLHSLRHVDVDTWLEAMPRSVVGPDVRARVVERMLRGVPLPPGFDREALEDDDLVLNHYQLAAEVAKAVSCGWVERWLTATQSGDGADAREAVAAMATWRRWAMMPTPADNGRWSANIKMAARSIATGHVNRGPAGSVINPDGSGYELGPAWAVALDCTQRYWRHPIEP
jgi:hypothetical protein